MKASTRTGATSPNGPDGSSSVPPNDQPFAQLARLGRTSPGRHAAALGIIMGCWIGLGGVATLALMELFAAAGPPALAGYLVVNAPFPFLLLGLLIAVRTVHARGLRTLVTPRDRIDLGRIATAFGLFLCLALTATLIEAGMDPDRFRWAFTPAWLLTLPVIVVVTSLQTTAEELFFRGYLLQTTGLFIRRTWLLVLVNTVLFALPHLLNPELASGPLQVGAIYFGLGAFFTLLTLRDNRLELALGAHAANNLIAALVVNHPHSSLPTKPIWEVRDLNPTFALVSLLVCAPVFYWVMVTRGRSQQRPSSGERRPGGAHVADRRTAAGSGH